MGAGKHAQERPVNTRGGAYPWCSLSCSVKRELFSGPHHIHAFYHPSIPLSLFLSLLTSSTGGGRPPGIRGQGSEKKRRAFLLSFSHGTKKGKCLCVGVYQRGKRQENCQWLFMYICMIVSTDTTVHYIWFITWHLMLKTESYFQYTCTCYNN